MRDFMEIIAVSVSVDNNVLSKFQRPVSCNLFLIVICFFGYNHCRKSILKPQTKTRLLCNITPTFANKWQSDLGLRFA